MSPFTGKYRRLIIALCVTVAIIFIVPVHSVQSHATLLRGNKMTQEQQVMVTPTEETDIQNYKRPSYFSIFKFIISFLPGTQR